MTDVVIAGGGVGGVAAALAAVDLGATVALFEESPWVGGQLTNQAVPSDEHGWIESDGVGATRSYREFRAALRQSIVNSRSLIRGALGLNPGLGRVSPICSEPATIVAVLDEFLAARERTGRLQVFRGHRLSSVDVHGDSVTAATFVDSDGNAHTVSGAYFIDATEEGDGLALAGCEHVLGSESQDQTGELHAVPGAPDQWAQQAVTWCMAVELRPGENHIIDKPDQYSHWSNYQPEFWPDKLLSFTTPHPWTLQPRHSPLFGDAGLWTFRRIRYGGHYAEPTTDITLMNWPQNDYFLAPVVGVAEADRLRRLEEARQLSLSMLYWCQTEAPRHDGGSGYPELRPCPEVMGTPDGLAMRPYIREGRRIVARTTVTENDIGVEARRGLDRARQFADSVGIGAYRIDLHPTTVGRNYVDISSYPFQIPLGSLLPVRVTNLIAGAKNIGTTHITNGAYRVHPVEWNIGESAGSLAAFCVSSKQPPAAVHERNSALADFQRILDSQRQIELCWPESYRTRQV